MTLLSSPASADPIGATLIPVIRHAADNAPRSLQETIGPSEMGIECDRRLAMKMAGTPKINVHSDPLPSIIGVATHTWLANAFTADNANYPQLPRWLVETTVYPDDAHPGSCDLYDVHKAAVIDWKVLGATSMKTYKASGPPPYYVVQSHLYGLGYERLGFQVATVAIVMLPRGGMLSGLHTWSEPYDRNVALEALERVGDIACNLNDASNVHTDEVDWSAIEASPGPSCNYCPYKRPGPVDGTGCPGETP